jgi:hypothetical protein
LITKVRSSPFPGHVEIGVEVLKVDKWADTSSGSVAQSSALSRPLNRLHHSDCLHPPATASSASNQATWQLSDVVDLGLVSKTSLVFSFSPSPCNVDNAVTAVHLDKPAALMIMTKPIRLRLPVPIPLIVLDATASPIALSAFPPSKSCLRPVRSPMRMSTSISRLRSCEVTDEISSTQREDEPGEWRTEVREIAEEVAVDRRGLCDALLV